MRAEEVIRVLDALAAREVRAWLDGGWGVDALLGEQTREHDDVDIVVDLRCFNEVVVALTPLGYGLSEDYLPTRAVLRSTDCRQVDVHPVVFDPDGTGRQYAASPNGDDAVYPASGFGKGRVLDRVVPCLTPELQLRHHSGYAPRDRDRSDVDRLVARFGLTKPSGY